MKPAKRMAIASHRMAVVALHLCLMCKHTQNQKQRVRMAYNKSWPVSTMDAAMRKMMEDDASLEDAHQKKHLEMRKPHTA